MSPASGLADAKTAAMSVTHARKTAEFERALIQERVRAGLRNARAKGKRLGRPRVRVDAAKVAALRAAGVPWQSIADQLGIGVGTACRAFEGLSKNLPESGCVSLWSEKGGTRLWEPARKKSFWKGIS